MLTLKKRLFIDNYKLTKNASKSALVAGYSPKNAPSYGAKLLKQPQIAQILLEWEQTESKRLEAEMIERKTLLNPSKGSYIERTFEKAEKVSHAPTAAKYWELGGKALGFVGNDQNSANSSQINLQIIANELNLNLPGRTQQLNSEPQHIVVQSSSPNSVQFDTNHNTLPINKLQSECPIISDYVNDGLLKSEGPPQGETPPRPGQNININTPPNSEPILNSVNTSHTTEATQRHNLNDLQNPNKKKRGITAGLKRLPNGRLEAA